MPWQQTIDIFSGIAWYYGDNDSSYEPSISLHVQIQARHDLPYLDTDSHMTCSTRLLHL